MTSGADSAGGFFPPSAPLGSSHLLHDCYKKGIRALFTLVASVSRQCGEATIWRALQTLGPRFLVLRQSGSAVTAATEATTLRSISAPD